MVEVLIQGLLFKITVIHYIYYAVPKTNNEWIGISAGGTGYGGNRRYKTSIYCIGVPTKPVTGTISSDDQALSLKVNGTTQLTNLTANDTTSHENKNSFSIPASAFTTGANEILIEVNDATDVAGLLVEFDLPEGSGNFSIYFKFTF